MADLTKGQGNDDGNQVIEDAVVHKCMLGFLHIRGDGQIVLPSRN